MSEIFGGSKSKSSSSAVNRAYEDVNKSLAPQMSTGTMANTQMANMLGLNGADAQGAGFVNWKNSTGYQSGLQEGLDGVTQNQAVGGMLNSGSTLKALSRYGSDYANSKFGEYQNQLQGVVNSGTQAAAAIGSTGQVQKSEATEKKSSGGLGKALGFFATQNPAFLLS
jgi:hypothetical protein